MLGSDALLPGLDMWLEALMDEPAEGLSMQVEEEEAEAVSPKLKEVNRRLADYNQEWDQLVDCWLVLRVRTLHGQDLVRRDLI